MKTFVKARSDNERENAMEYRICDADVRALLDLALSPGPAPEAGPNMAKTLLVLSSALRAEAAAARHFDLALDPLTPIHSVHLGREGAVASLHFTLEGIMQVVRDSQLSVSSFTKRADGQAVDAPSTQDEFDDLNERTIVSVHRDGASIICTAISRGCAQPPFSDRELVIASTILASPSWTALATPTDACPTDSSLSSRAREVLELFKDGRAEKEIARQMAISHHTVHVYAKRIYAHYGVGSRGELLSLWLRKVS